MYLFRPLPETLPQTTHPTAPDRPDGPDHPADRSSDRLVLLPAPLTTRLFLALWLVVLTIAGTVLLAHILLPTSQVLLLGYGQEHSLSLARWVRAMSPTAQRNLVVVSSAVISTLLIVLMVGHVYETRRPHPTTPVPGAPTPAPGEQDQQEHPASSGRSRRPRAHRTTRLSWIVRIIDVIKVLGTRFSDIPFHRMFTVLAIVLAVVAVGAPDAGADLTSPDSYPRSADRIDQITAQAIVNGVAVFTAIAALWHLVTTTTDRLLSTSAHGVQSRQ